MSKVLCMLFLSVIQLETLHHWRPDKMNISLNIWIITTEGCIVNDNSQSLVKNVATYAIINTFLAWGKLPPPRMFIRLVRSQCLSAYFIKHFYIVHVHYNWAGSVCVLCLSGSSHSHELIFFIPNLFRCVFPPIISLI